MSLPPSSHLRLSLLCFKKSRDQRMLWRNKIRITQGLRSDTLPRPSHRPQAAVAEGHNFPSSHWLRGRQMIQFQTYDRKTRRWGKHALPSLGTPPTHARIETAIFSTQISHELTLFLSRTLGWILVKRIWSDRDKRSKCENYKKNLLKYRRISNIFLVPRNGLGESRMLYIK